MITPSQIQKFWANVDKNGPNGCWIWIGRTWDKRGYGDLAGKRAHRVSWIIHFGEIPVGDLVCHKCDNPPCVNPDHLFLGTVRDNNKDCCIKDRQMRGERHYNSVLKEEQVREIFKSQLPRRELAKIYKVSPVTIKGIQLGYKWRHVTDEE